MGNVRGVAGSDRAKRPGPISSGGYGMVPSSLHTPSLHPHWGCWGSYAVPHGNTGRLTGLSHQQAQQARNCLEPHSKDVCDVLQGLC